MKSTFEKKTIFFFLLGVLAILSVLAIFFYNAQKVKYSNYWVGHAQDVLQSSDNILLDVLNMETGSRGFILTGEERFLRPYYIGAASVNSNLVIMVALTKDNPNLKARTDSLGKAISEKIVFTRNSIETRRLKGFNAAKRSVVEGSGRRQSDKIRKILESINIEEINTLKIQKYKNEKSNYFAQLILILPFFIVAFIVALIIVIIKNQKSRNRHEQELVRSNILFTSLFDYNPASISISQQSDHRILNVNNSFLQLYGFDSKNEILGKTNEELNLLINSDVSDEFVRLMNENNVVKDFEINVRTKRGELKWTSASALFLEVDDIPCLFTVSIDITNRKKAEEQLVAVNKELEAFTYSVSHDLRAPLRAINGYANILQEDFATMIDEEGIKILYGILKNSKKMGDLIDDLLAFSRLGRKVVPTSEINMAVLVNLVKEEVLFGNKKEIEFIIHELPPAMGQQALIKQVWVNLISNAVKYSKNSPHTIIEIGAYNKDKQVVYFVKDNGAGFDMLYYDKLFGIFQRLHSQEEFEGTGIGLAIVQKIIQRHNGKVWAEAKINEGACFYFSLPVINF